jgi:pimeloyl-ACP methyl ester carboxylesterase
MGIVILSRELSGPVNQSSHAFLKVLKLVLLVAVTWLACPQAATTAAANAAVEDRMVDVGGIKMHFRVSPGCGLTILLESGGGLDASQWVHLQPQLSADTGAAIVSYDRAGFGRSDLPKGTYGLTQQVSWLKAGLKSLRVPDDIVLVGHSYGALLNQLYANQFPAVTKAIVLIDPNSVAFIDAVGGPSALPLEIPAAPVKLRRATENQRDTIVQDVADVRAAPLSQSIPLVVIAAGKRWFPTDEWNDKFDAARRSLVAGNPNASLVVAEGSGHMVTQERPELVLSTIEKQVAAVRASGVGSTAGACRKAASPAS